MRLRRCAIISPVAALLVNAVAPGGQALPHEFFPTYGKTDALTLAFYVKSSVGEIHFITIPSSVKASPSALTAADIVEPSRHEVLKEQVSSQGSFSVRAGERSTHEIDGLTSGEAYDVFFITESANSNGLFSPVGKILGVSTNGAAPSISKLVASPVDAATNAAVLFLSMDAPGVTCRVWYTLLPLIDTVLLKTTPFSAEEVAEAAKPNSVIALPQGLKGERSPGTIIDNLEGDTWYQVSAVAERADGVFSEPIFSVVKTHREPPSLIEVTAKPLQRTTDSLALLFRLDCSASPMGEVCGLLSYQVSEKPPRGSPQHAKPRLVAQGKVAIMDGGRMGHDISGLSPGKTHSITMMVETPDSYGAFGPAVEVEASTFQVAPRLVMLEATRAVPDPSTVLVRYKLSQPGIVHISLAERVGNPLAMQAALAGSQHGVSFFREVGIGEIGDEENEKQTLVLEGSQELQGLVAGSAFDVTARTESALMSHPSGVFGECTYRVIEAVPPVLVNVRTHAPDATTTELLVEYEVRGTAGRVFYALAERPDVETGGQGLSAEGVLLAVQGQSGVVATGSTLVFPRVGRESSHGDEQLALERIHIRGLQPNGRYALFMCTEGNSGRLSAVVTAFAQPHAEAPLVIAVTATPADRSSGALSLAVALESMGLVHFIVRRADEHNGGVIRDHTIVRKGILDANNTSASPTSPRGGAATGVVDGPVKVVETVEGLEPNATYEVFLTTETINSNGIYRQKMEPLMATTHPMPPAFLDARARAADASASALIVTASLQSPGGVHYAVFLASSDEVQPGDRLDGILETLGATSLNGQSAETEEPKSMLTGYHNIGCTNATVSGRGPLALNETAGLVTSGVVWFSRNNGSSGDDNNADTRTDTTAPKAGSAKTSTTLPTSYAVRSSAIPSVMKGGDAFEAEIYVEGLNASEAYDLCLFSETPESNGLFGLVHTLRGVSTHALVPELALERVACSLDCRGLNRDPCWLEDNKCGECSEGFVGKAGHVNSLCGKVSLLTEADIAQIAKRKREQEGERNPANSYEQNANDDHSLSKETIVAGEVSDPARETSLTTSTPEGVADEGNNPPAASKLLGVPVEVGPNATKFLYVDVPAMDESGANSTSKFDAETAASELCAELHNLGGGDREEARACLASLAVALASRFNDGRLHAADSERPILQVEVDTPRGGSLAFTLMHGQDAGSAAVGFCRENRKHLPEEQECVVTLMQEISHVHAS